VEARKVERAIKISAARGQPCFQAARWRAERLQRKSPASGRGLELAMSAAHFFGHGDWKPYPRKESVWVMHILPRLFGPGAAYHSYGWAEFAAYDEVEAA